MIDITENSKWKNRFTDQTWIFNYEAVADEDDDDLLKGDVVFIMKNEATNKLAYWLPDDFDESFIRLQ